MPQLVVQHVGDAVFCSVHPSAFIRSCWQLGTLRRRAGQHITEVLVDTALIPQPL
jgi:hypothetical protein